MTQSGNFWIPPRMLKCKVINAFDIYTLMKRYFTFKELKIKYPQIITKISTQ